MPQKQYQVNEEKALIGLLVGQSQSLWWQREVYHIFHS